jgi:transcriptional regulator of acetoin/glycerol metabolism
MDITAWLEARRTLGTAAELARVTAAANADYAVVERDIRRFHILEVLVANDGNHAAAAKVLRVHRHTIHRTLKALGLHAHQIREIAKQINSNGRKNGN